MRDVATRGAMRAAQGPQGEAPGSVHEALRPGGPLPDHLEIVVLGSNNRPGNFVMRSGIDDVPIGPMTTPGKSAAIATDLTLETEIPKMFGCLPGRGDTLSGAFVEVIRAAGFDASLPPHPAIRSM